MKKLLLFLIVTLTVVTAKAQYLSIGNLKYYITDDYAYTLECVGLSGAGQSANPTEIDIPGKIEYGGSTYTVTNVGSSAFSGNTTISVLKVCYGVTSIGTSAFSGCTALSYVYLPSSVNTIDNYAFANTSKMAQFNYAAQRVPTVYSNTFSGMRSASLVLSTMEAKSAFNSSSTFTTAFSGISANGRGANDFSSGAGCYVVNGSNTCMLTVPPALVCFLESNDYIDCLKLAIALGGDSDTLAAIAGPIAYAFYRNIPQPLIDNARKLLPKWMLEVSDQLDQTVNQNLQQ